MYLKEKNFLYKVANDEVGYISRYEDYMQRGFVQNMVTSTYNDTILVYPETGQNMNNWLNAKNLPSDFTPEQCIKLYEDLFVVATGIELNSLKQSKDLQEAMISIMRDLSSYSVQFITSINSDVITPLNWAMIRPGQADVSEQDLTHAYDLDVRFKHRETKERSTTHVKLHEVVISDISSEMSSLQDIPSGLSIIDTPVKEAGSDFYDLGHMNFVEETPLTYPGASAVSYIPEYQYFYDLNSTQQQSLLSVYHVLPTIKINDKVDIGDVLSRDVVDSFKYFSFDKPKITSFKFKYMPSMLTFGVKPVLFDELGKMVYAGGAFSDDGFVYIGILLGGEWAIIGGSRRWRPAPFLAISMDCSETTPDQAGASPGAGCGSDHLPVAPAGAGTDGQGSPDGRGSHPSVCPPPGATGR
jgi:hypothetical protein